MIGAAEDPQAKLFGVYDFEKTDVKHPVTQGLDDIVPIPQSRYGWIEYNDVRGNDNLALLLQGVSDDPRAAVQLVADQQRRFLYLLGHPEYGRLNLDQEYKRDIRNGNHIALPKNYYPNDDPTSQLLSAKWHDFARSLYQNWINDVYQTTNVDIRKSVM